LSWKKIEINKVTPRFDRTWYIKWIASILLLISMVMTANFDLHPWNIMIAACGTTGWFIVGMMWHDRSLIFINAIATGIYTHGTLIYYLGKYVHT
jgi:hypothetical protein